MSPRASQDDLTRAQWRLAAEAGQSVRDLRSDFSDFVMGRNGSLIDGRNSDLAARQRFWQHSIGAALRHAQRLNHIRKTLLDASGGSVDIGRVTIAEASRLSGISRPTLHKLRDPANVPAGSGYGDWTNAELAHQMLRAPADGVVDEFHARFPALAAWQEAIEFLTPYEPDPRFTIPYSKPGSENGSQMLRKEYRRRIQAIADSEPPGTWDIDIIEINDTDTDTDTDEADSYVGQLAVRHNQRILSRHECLDTARAVVTEMLRIPLAGVILAPVPDRIGGRRWLINTPDPAAAPISGHPIPRTQRSKS